MRNPGPAVLLALAVALAPLPAAAMSCCGGMMGSKGGKAAAGQCGRNGAMGGAMGGAAMSGAGRHVHAGHRGTKGAMGAGAAKGCCCMGEAMSRRG